MKRRTRAVIFILAAAWFSAASIRGVVWHLDSMRGLGKLGWVMMETYGLAIFVFVVGLFLFLRARTSRPYLRIPQQAPDIQPNAPPSPFTCTLRICISGAYNDWIASLSDDVMRLECHTLNRSIVINRKLRVHIFKFPNMFSDFDLIIEDSLGEEMIVFCDGKRLDAKRIQRWWLWPLISPQPPSHGNPSPATPPQSIALSNHSSNIAHPKTGISITSLVCSLFGLAYPTSILFFSSIAGIIFGHIAIYRIKRSPSEYGGFKRALAGVILGYIAVALGLILGFTIASNRMKLRQMGFPI